MTRLEAKSISDNELDALVVDGDEVQRTELSVDVRDKLRHLTFELRRVGQRRRRNLDKDDIPNPLRVILQELLEGTKLR